MKFITFIDFIHNGAFTAFENFITCLSNSDLKSLRLVLPMRLAGSILPYMFRQIYLSVHNEDIKTFREVINRPHLCQRVLQINWDISVCQTRRPVHIFNRITGHEDVGIEYDLHLLRQRGRGPLNLPNDTKNIIHVEAIEFWGEREDSWIRNAEQWRDLQILEQAILHFPNLQRINVLVEQENPSVPEDHYRKLWTSPRERLWSKTPFYAYLPSPRPATSREISSTFSRALRHINHLCETHKTQIGALILDAYGFSTLAPDNQGTTDETDQRFATYNHFDKVLHGFGETATNLPILPKLTLRIITEDLSAHWAWQSNNVLVATLSILSASQLTTIEELTYCRINNEFAPVIHPTSAATFGLPDPFNKLSTMTNLRRVRLYEYFCFDAAEILGQLRHRTTTTEIELHSVRSDVSWYTVMMDLKAQGITFDVFEVVSCRSLPEHWLPGFDGEELAPWNGESKDTVPWLRGETHLFPLWQGPG